MVDIEKLMSLQAQLFLLMALGVICRRCLVSAACQKGLTDLLVDLVMPCNILASFQITWNLDILRQSAAILVLSLGIQIASTLLSFVLYRRVSPGKRPILQYGTTASNAGFLGLPVAEGLFGPDGVLLASIYLIPQRIFMWSVGLSFFQKGSGQDVCKRLLTHPCILAVCAGLILMFTQAQLPAFLTGTINSLSKCCTALSMLVIGMVISRFSLRQLLDPAVWYYALIRLAVLPALTLVCCRAFHAQELAANVSLVLVCMPAAGTTAVLAAKYGADESFAASCVAHTTLLSLAAIPLWCLAL